MLKTENDSIRSMKKHEIQARLLDLQPDMPPYYAHRLAGQWKRAAQRRDLGFYEAARVLGIYTDATPRKALRNVQGAMA